MKVKKLIITIVMFSIMTHTSFIREHTKKLSLLIKEHREKLSLILGTVTVSAVTYWYIKNEKEEKEIFEIQKNIVRGFCQNKIKWYKNTNEECYSFYVELKKKINNILCFSPEQREKSMKIFVKENLSLIGNYIEKNNIVLIDSNGRRYDSSTDALLLQPLLQYLIEQFFFSNMFSDDQEMVSVFNDLNNLVSGKKEDIEQKVDMFDSSYRAFIKIYFIDRWNGWLYSNKISVEEKSLIEKKQSNNATSLYKENVNKKEIILEEIEKKILRAFSQNTLILRNNNGKRIQNYEFFDGLRRYSKDQLNDKDISFSLSKGNIERFIEKNVNLVRNYIEKENIILTVRSFFIDYKNLVDC